MWSKFKLFAKAAGTTALKGLKKAAVKVAGTAAGKKVIALVTEYPVASAAVGAALGTASIAAICASDDLDSDDIIDMYMSTLVAGAALEKAGKGRGDKEFDDLYAVGTGLRAAAIESGYTPEEMAKLAQPANVAQWLKEHTEVYAAFKKGEAGGGGIPEIKDNLAAGWGGKDTKGSTPEALPTLGAGDSSAWAGGGGGSTPAATDGQGYRGPATTQAAFERMPDQATGAPGLTVVSFTDDEMARELASDIKTATGFDFQRSLSLARAIRKWGH